MQAKPPATPTAAWQRVYLQYVWAELAVRVRVRVATCVVVAIYVWTIYSADM
jgi:hypothetical protein